MQIPINDRRKLITNLFLKRDYKGLENLGLKIVGDSAEYDCGNYVLKSFGFPGNDNTLHYLRTLTKEDEGDIVFYGVGKGNRFDVKHYGLIKGKKVESKWEHGPVFLHDLLDVPDYFGTEVMFGSVNELRNKMFASQFGQMPEEDYY
jgi:hypothetical protein